MIVSYISIPCFTIIPVIIKLQAVLCFEKLLCNSSLSGYADLTMIIGPDKRYGKVFDVLIEFKFVRLKDVGISADQAKQLSETELIVRKNQQKKFHGSNLEGGSLVSYTSNRGDFIL